MPEVEIYAPTGVLAGEAAGVPLTEDGPDLETPLALADARWYPLDGGTPVSRGDVRVPTDEILLVVTDEHDMTVHMSWYPITLVVGPYRVTASIGMMPGFDPERALARPGGTYVPLREVTIELIGRTDVEPARRPHLAVNRYAVEHCDCTLMLGFHFPGAQFVKQEAVPVA